LALIREASQFANRGLHYHYDDDGSLVLQACLPAESGALLIKALERATEDACRAGVSAETPDLVDGSPGLSDPPVPTPGQRRADALVRFAETWLASGDLALSGGDRQQIVVHVDIESLRGINEVTMHSGAGTSRVAGVSSEAALGRCEMEDGPALATQTARRLSCDASIVRIVEDAFGRTLDVGRKTRSIPPAIRRALRSRDDCCRFPGCAHTRFLDGHHIRHWADGGATRLSNLVLLCRFHHRQVHEGRINVRMLDDGALRFSGADGRPFEAAMPTTGDSRELVLRHRDDGLVIDAGTAVTRWRGERLDYGMAVEGLLIERERGRRRGVSAETHR